MSTSLRRISSLIWDPIPYETLQDDDEDITEPEETSLHHKKKQKRLLMVTLLLTVLCMALFYSPSRSNNLDNSLITDIPLIKKHHHHHHHNFNEQEEDNNNDDDDKTIPTALSLVHPQTYRYLNALDNPLYDRLLSHSSRTFTMDDTRGNHHQRRHLRTLKDVKTPPSLHLSSTQIRVRDSLVVSWTPGKTTSGDSILTDDHVVTLHCPPDSSIFTEAATLAQLKATSAHHLSQQPQRELTQTLDNEWFIPQFSILRQDSCQFRLYEVQEDDLSLLAVSPTLFLQDSTKTPTNVHLAYTSTDTSMRVSFVTGETGTPVCLITNNKGHSQKVEGTSSTYTASDLCQAPANATEPGKFSLPGQLHTIVLTDLEYNTKYTYKVGLASGQGIVWSDEYHFTSGVPVGDTAEFSYFVYGDQGCPSDGWGRGAEYVSAMATREASNTSLRGIHHFGDLSYAQGAAHVWDEWFHMIEGFSTQVALHVSIGNHEYDHTDGGSNGKDPSGVEEDHGFMPEWGNFGQDSGGECGVPTAARFTMPQSTTPTNLTSNGVFWYSHNYASVHTVVISSEHNVSAGSPQYEWLQADLAAVNRSITPWVILESHRPLYESEASWDQNAVGVAMRYEFEDLILQHRVDVVLSGHYHMYMRTCDGLYRGKCGQAGAPLHIVIGSAGAALDDAPVLPKSWNAHVIQHQYGYGRITVANASALHFEFVKAGAENDTEAGTVQDDVWVWRDRS